MIRLTRLADYGIMLMAQFAHDPQVQRSARELAEVSRLPLPTVSKILKALARNKLLQAHRGVKGGFALARGAEQISVADIIEAIEGPISFTECCGGPGTCGVESNCHVGANWRRINFAVSKALRDVTLSDLSRPHSASEFKIPV